jgi:hypothetical protein
MGNQILIKAILLLLLSLGFCLLFSLPFRYAVLRYLELYLSSFGLDKKLSFGRKARRRGISDFEALADRQPASPELQAQLLTLVGGDRALAEEWVTKARFGHAGQTEDYYWQRAIELCQQAR